MAVLEVAAAGVGDAEAAGVFDAVDGDALLRVWAADSGVAADPPTCGAGVDDESPAADSIEDGDAEPSFAIDGDGSSFARRCSK